MPEKSDTKSLKPRKKAKSTTKASVKSSKKSVKSDNQESSLSSSILIQNNFQKQKPKHKSNSSKSIPKYSKLQINSKEGQNNFEIPKNVAVHFGNYYGLNESSAEKKSQNATKNSLRDPRFSAFSHNKTQFTRQMVYKLVSSAGKQNYAKEVSTLLEETVEPPSFKINLPPPENSIPNGKPEASYPLWYKDPAKLLFSTSQGDGSFNEKYEKLGSYLSKYKSKNRLDYEKVLKRKKRDNKEGLESLEGESDKEEESLRNREKEARGSTSLSESASSNSNLTSGWSSVTGKSATGSTSTIESESDSEEEDKEDDDDSASSSLSRSLAIADNESQGVNVPVVAH